MTQTNEHVPTRDGHLDPTAPNPLEYQPDQTTLFAAQLAILLLRIVAIVFIALGLPVFNAFSFAFARIGFSSSMGWMDFAWPLLSYGVYFVAAVVLFWSAPVWGPKLVRSSPGFDGPKTNSANVQAIAFSILGIYIVCDSFPGLIRLIELSHQAERLPIQDFILYGVKIALGIVLFLGARGLAMFWHKIRSSARYDEVQSPRES